MVESFVRDLRLLWKADGLIAEIWLAAEVRRSGILLFAGLVAMFGLGMGNLAAYEWLRVPSGPIAAAGLMSLADFVLAGVLASAAGRIKPGPEITLALEIRQQAMDGLQADARDLQSEIGQLRADLASARSHVSGFLHDPLDLASRKLLVPMVTSLITGLVSRRPVDDHANSKV